MSPELKTTAKISGYVTHNFSGRLKKYPNTTKIIILKFKQTTCIDKRTNIRNVLSASQNKYI